jgi:hypothetical protein
MQTGEIDAAPLQLIKDRGWIVFAKDTYKAGARIPDGRAERAIQQRSTSRPILVVPSPNTTSSTSRLPRRMI